MNLPPHVPFQPHRAPIFYGWVILVIGSLGVLMSAPGQTVGVSAFTDFLIRDLRITRTHLSLAYLIGTLGSSLVLSRAGRVYDLHGARLVGTVVAFSLGLIPIALSLIPETTAAMVDRIPALSALPVAFVLVTVAFFLLRFFGQGVLALVARNMVLKWFDRRRGFANAIVGVATTVGFSSSPLIFNGLIENFGWQTAWRFIGLVVAVPFAALFLLFSRDNPHECGLEPDGGHKPRRIMRAPETYPSADFTLREAQSTLTLWVFLGIATMASMYFTGLTFNIVSVFGEAGLDRARAVSVFLPSSIIALVLNFAGGWISDYIRLKYIVMVQGVGILISTFAVIRIGEPYMVLLFIVANGVNSGMFGIVAAVPWPRFYGILHLGRISGFVMGWTVAGSAIGPYLFSIVLDTFGSYAPASMITAVFTVLLLILSPWANRPDPPRRGEKQRAYGAPGNR
jgi:MFS transporter, OFA family, oxalate/formate antiporter